MTKRIEVQEYILINGQIVDHANNVIATVAHDVTGHLHAENNNGEVISIHEETPNAKAYAVCSILPAYL